MQSNGLVWKYIANKIAGTVLRTKSSREERSVENKRSPHRYNIISTMIETCFHLALTLILYTWGSSGEDLTSACCMHGDVLLILCLRKPMHLHFSAFSQGKRYRRKPLLTWIRLTLIQTIGHLDRTVDIIANRWHPYLHPQIIPICVKCHEWLTFRCSTFI